MDGRCDRRIKLRDVKWMELDGGVMAGCKVKREREERVLCNRRKSANYCVLDGLVCFVFLSTKLKFKINFKINVYIYIFSY
jgi:hypothetical protein